MYSLRVSLETSVLTNILNANSACPAQNWDAYSLILPNSASIIHSAPNQRVHILTRCQLPRRRLVKGRSLRGAGEIESHYCTNSVQISFSFSVKSSCTLTRILSRFIRFLVTIIETCDESSNNIVVD